MIRKNKIFVLIVLLLLFAASFLIPHKARSEAPNMGPMERYEIEIEAWLDRLEFDESRGNKMLVVLDTNAKYSHGCLQYQLSTWLADSKKYGIEGEMMDCSKQRQLARITVESDPNGWKKWKTSVTKKTAGMPPQKPAQ